MLLTLRNRLLLSYVAILLILLVLVGFVLLVFLATRPLPTEEITNDLTATLLDVRVLETVRLEIQPGDWSVWLGRNNNGNGQTLSMPSIRRIEQTIVGYLTDESSSRDVRTLIINGQGIVRFDSAGAFVTGERVQQIDQEELLHRGIGRLNAVYQGHFSDPDGEKWLYVAQPLRPMAEIQADSLFVIVAAPVPHPTLGEVFRVFGDTFFMPLAQAGLIGLVIAVGLSVLISGSVARPLQRMSEAARRIARGDYRQRVPVNGPREVRALAGSFNEMAERVAATQQAQRDFLANVSHDLRTPLTSIQGFSQAIAEGVAGDQASAQRAALIIHDEAARMHRMVESLLDLARIEAGQLDLKPRAIAPSELLLGIGESLSVRARDKGLNLALDVPPDLPRIAGDGDRLAQVFNNLLDNAIKHTPQGGNVRLHAQTAQRGIAVTVQDSGEGIPADDLPRIFERFYQVDKSRQHDRRSGMGLGLAIVRQIVQLHGGTINVASEIGHGTTFTVWLPLPTPAMTTVSGRR
ncbi:MAG: HAMP domain-containing histidine kinase [Chloroflexi bacterium]|nr:HAMP domain-containing histidine kinase [Chloroflexota bacterium]